LDLHLATNCREQHHQKIQQPGRNGYLVDWMEKEGGHKT
jgi:hypothetical protein